MTRDIGLASCAAGSRLRKLFWSTSERSDMEKIEKMTKGQEVFLFEARMTDEAECLKWLYHEKRRLYSQKLQPLL